MDAAGAAASYGTYQRVAEDGRCLNLVVPPASLSHRDMLKSNRIGHSTGIYDRHAVGDGARFQPIGHEDYAFRSEEHTSELQSLMRHSYAVFYLKKKKTT